MASRLVGVAIESDIMQTVRGIILAGTRSGANPFPNLSAEAQRLVVNTFKKYEEYKAKADALAHTLADAKDVGKFLHLQAQEESYRKLANRAEDTVTRIVVENIIHKRTGLRYQVHDKSEVTAKAHLPQGHRNYKNLVSSINNPGILIGKTKILNSITTGKVPPASTVRMQTVFASMGPELQGFLPPGIHIPSYRFDHIVAGILLRNAFIQTYIPGRSADAVGTAAMRVVHNGSTNFAVITNMLNAIKGAIETGTPYNGVYYASLADIMPRALVEEFAARARIHVDLFPGRVFDACRARGTPATPGTMDHAERIVENLLKSVPEVFGPEVFGVGAPAARGVLLPGTPAAAQRPLVLGVPPAAARRALLLGAPAAGAEPRAPELPGLLERAAAAHTARLLGDVGHENNSRAAAKAAAPEAAGAAPEAAGVAGKGIFNSVFSFFGRAAQANTRRMEEEGGVAHENENNSRAATLTTSRSSSSSSRGNGAERPANEHGNNSRAATPTTSRSSSTASHGNNSRAASPNPLVNQWGGGDPTLDEFNQLIKIITNIENLIDIYFNDLEFTYDDLFNKNRNTYIKNSPIKNVNTFIHTNDTNKEPIKMFFPPQELLDKYIPTDTPLNLKDAEITLFLVQYYNYILGIYNDFLMKLENEFMLEESKVNNISSTLIPKNTFLMGPRYNTGILAGGNKTKQYKKTRKHRSKKHKRYSRKK